MFYNSVSANAKRHQVPAIAVTTAYPGILLFAASVADKYSFLVPCVFILWNIVEHERGSTPGTTDHLSTVSTSGYRRHTLAKCKHKNIFLFPHHAFYFCNCFFGKYFEFRMESFF